MITKWMIGLLSTAVLVLMVYRVSESTSKKTPAPQNVAQETGLTEFRCDETCQSQPEDLVLKSAIESHFAPAAKWESPLEEQKKPDEDPLKTVKIFVTEQPTGAFLHSCGGKPPEPELGNPKELINQPTPNNLPPLGIDAKPGVIQPVEMREKSPVQEMPMPAFLNTIEPPKVEDLLPTIPTRYVNQRKVSFNFQVTKKGRSGIQAVELWSTPDQGQSWSRMARKEAGSSPIEADLTEEGTYGFRIVLVSGSGKASAFPQKGDLPELNVVYDSTLPQLNLMPLGVVENQAGWVEIRWKASDTYLHPKPMQISWSEDGKTWSPVSTDWISNTGALIWQVPESVPHHIYLRAQARDLAGNIAECRTPNKVSVDMVVPQAKMLDVVAAETLPMPRVARSTEPTSDIKLMNLIDDPEVQSPKPKSLELELRPVDKPRGLSGALEQAVELPEVLPYPRKSRQ